jgi:predicted transcriptional regulator
MGEERDAAGVLRKAAQRRAMLQELRAGGATRTDIQQALSVSRSTVHRVVREFESLGIVRRTDGDYELTPFGEVVVTETECAIDSIETADRLSPLLGKLDEADETTELSSFGNATVTTPKAGDPHLPSRRFLSSIEAATRIREFTPTAPEPAYQQKLHERVESGLDAAVVYSEAVVKSLRASGQQTLELAVENDGFELRVGSLPQFRLVLADEHLFLGGYNDDASQLELVADTDERGAVGWGKRCFRDRWEAATPYETYAAADDS